MRNYSIDNFLCDRTYGGVYTMSDIAEVNKMVLERATKTLEKHYGTDRPIKFDAPTNLNYAFKSYIFIAWLDGDILSEDEDEDYHGHHLFVIGFTDSPDKCVEDIYEMGDEYFAKEAQGFYC